MYDRLRGEALAELSVQQCLHALRSKTIDAYTAQIGHYVALDIHLVRNERLRREPRAH